MRTMHCWKYVLAIMLAATLGHSACGGDDDAMPDVTGKTREDAETELKELNLEVTVKEAPSAEKTGSVISQQPAAGQPFPDDDKVTITVATAQAGPIDTTNGTDTPDIPPSEQRVPGVVGLQLAEAEQKLQAAGTKLGFITPQPSDRPDLTVLSQNPPEGEAAPVSGVDLTVSENTTVPVPTLIGDTEQDAVAKIQNAGLQIGAIDSALEGAGAIGRVILQSPDPNFPAPRNAPVRIVIKQDAVRVPAVIGQTLTAAGPALVKSGLSFRSRRTIDKTRPSGTIVNLNPGPNQLVARNGTVDLTYTTPNKFMPGGKLFLEVAALNKKATQIEAMNKVTLSKTMKRTHPALKKKLPLKPSGGS